MSTTRSRKSALESMMFIWGDVLSVRDAAEILNITKDEARDCFEELREDLEEGGRGIRLRKVNDGYQFVTAMENAEYIERLCRPVKKRRLSQSALEVLAIVAYRQPVTRGEVDSLRGIKSDRVLEGLAKRELIEEKGRSDAIGCPILYGTTDTFLKTFGFESLSDMPDITSFAEDAEIEVSEDAEGYMNGVMVNQISLEEMAKK